MQIMPKEFERYSRQIKLHSVGVSGQMKLKNTRVLCVGAGGLGSSLLLYLAASGVGTISIIDDDAVELSNLQRQVLYNESHLGLHKVSAAKMQLSALNANTTIHPHVARLHSRNASTLIAQHDIVADCTDNFATRYLINDICYKLNKPFVFASIHQYQGQCATFLGGDHACFRCLYPDIPNQHLIANCEESGVLGVVPGLLGMIQANEIIKYSLGLETSLANTLLTVDLLTMQFKHYALSKNPECRLCVYHDPLDSFMQDATCEFTKSYALSIELLQTALTQSKDILLIDVRTQEEHERYNIGGQLIPLSQFKNRLHELPREKSIIVYCQSDYRSRQAIKLLINSGIKSARFLQGGLDQLNKLTHIQNSNCLFKQDLAIDA